MTKNYIQETMMEVIVKNKERKYEKNINKNYLFVDQINNIYIFLRIK